MRDDLARKANRQGRSSKRNNDPEEKASEIYVFWNRSTRAEQDQSSGADDGRDEDLKVSRNRHSPHLREDTGESIKGKVATTERGPLGPSSSRAIYAALEVATCREVRRECLPGGKTSPATEDQGRERCNRCNNSTHQVCPPFASVQSGSRSDGRT